MKTLQRISQYRGGRGSRGAPHALTCYESETGAVWIPVTDVLCVLVETPAGNLGILLVGGTPGWFFFFVVVF